MGGIEVPILEAIDCLSKIRPSISYEAMRHFTKYYGSRVIPLEIPVKSIPAISSTEELLGIIERMPSLGVGYCYCRAKKHNCTNDLWTCIHIGTAKSLHELKDKMPLKSATVDDVKLILKKADKNGLVHQLITAPNSNYFYVICNCCPCCCVMLESARKYSGTNIAVASNFIAINNENCTNCGECVSRCYFGARLMDGDQLIVNTDRCSGCGLCISFCSNNAIQLVQRSSKSQIKCDVFPL